MWWFCNAFDIDYVYDFCDDFGNEFGNDLGINCGHDFGNNLDNMFWIYVLMIILVISLNWFGS